MVIQIEMSVEEFKLVRRLLVQEEFRSMHVTAEKVRNEEDISGQQAHTESCRSLRKKMWQCLRRAT